MSIEKFSGSFHKEEHGCTILINETIQNIRDFEILGMFTYLMSKPSGWIINAKELSGHFMCGKDKIYRVINKLIEAKLLTKTVYREKGKYSRTEYVLHLKPLARIESSPLPENPEMVKPEMENPETYKTKNITNKRNKEIKNTISDNSFFEEIKNVYNEELPELPKAKVIDSNLKNQIKKMIKNWPNYQKDGEEFTIESFRDYLRVIKIAYSWLIKPYTTENGNIRRNNLRVLTRETTISKIVNGEYSAN